MLLQLLHRGDRLLAERDRPRIGTRTAFRVTQRSRQRLALPDRVMLTRLVLRLGIPFLRSRLGRFQPGEIGFYKLAIVPIADAMARSIPPQVPGLMKIDIRNAAIGGIFLCNRSGEIVRALATAI